MNKIRCECLYCGKKWVVEMGYGWKSHADACSKCGEKKNIKKKEESFETGDVFGYRFDPPFPPKSRFDSNDHEYPQYARYAD